MDTLATKSSVKVVGANGQISLGKEFAGRQVLVEAQEPPPRRRPCAPPRSSPTTNAGCTNPRYARISIAPWLGRNATPPKRPTQKQS